MSLKRASAGWLHVAGLGISLVIAGQFAGWNYGLAAGWGNMAVATGLMAMLCFGLALCVAELAAAKPHAGGLYSFCQSSFGNFAGYLVGISVFGALAFGSGAAASFISAYVEHVFGFGGAPLKLFLFAVMIAIHIRGAGEAMRWLIASGVIALLAILVFLVTMAPYFDPANLATPELPLTVTMAGVMSCVPFGIFMFLSIEQTAAAAEEVENPGSAIPKGFVAAITVLLISAMGILLLSAGGGGVAQVAEAEDPLLAALASPLAGGGQPVAATIVGLGAIVGLVATLFSLIYSASRQFYALSREGHLPISLSHTNARGAPDVALLMVAAIGMLGSFAPPDKVLLCVVLALTASYIIVLAAFIRQRTVEPDLVRPFRAWGGRATAIVCLALALMVFVACFQLDWEILGGIAAFLTVAIIARAMTRGPAPAESALDDA